MLAAPLLTRLYLGDGDQHGRSELATLLAYLLLPQIFFYGLGALLGAILNSRGVFGALAWAPVLNNVVVIAVARGVRADPGRIASTRSLTSEPSCWCSGSAPRSASSRRPWCCCRRCAGPGFRCRPLSAGWDPRLGAGRPAGRAGRSSTC